ncbi:MAG: 50S ribosomal protein L24e [Candidatus Diapherotrites archaeon]|nr:50S ribosomal protein L24e [Candidatus Diapherotrites archaeon]
MDCTFCGNKIAKGTGLLFVKKTGQVFSFCSRKCETNMIKLKRQPRKTRWTKEFAKTKAANIAQRQHEKAKKKEEVSS